MGAIDAVQLEILRNRFQAIAEEMGQVILRTGHTLYVKQTGDFGAMLATPEGDLFAVPQKVGINTITGLNMRAALALVDGYAEGDVVICNDPISTAGMVTHLPDLFTWRPIFHGGNLICFAGAFVHASDVGGRLPGSISPTSTDIYQEGLRIPATKLYQGGVLNGDLRRILDVNSRIGDQNWGDISAMTAALAIADRRIHQLIARYGLSAFQSGMAAVLDYAETKVRALIREIPDGRYSFSDYMEGDQFGWSAIRIKLTLEISGDEMSCDFTGSDLQVPGAFNLPTANQKAHYQLVLAFVNYFKTLDPGVPSNSGVVRPISTHAPSGTLLNPNADAAVGVRAATMYRIIDASMAVLGMARPDVLPAAGGGMGAIVLISTRASDGRLKVAVAQPLRGGSGGRPRMDGINGTSFQGGFQRNVPNEALEHELPILVERYGLREGSGGPGRYRGGLGTEFAFTLLAEEATITPRGMERYHFHPWGRDGGQHGTLGATLLRRRGDETERSLGKIDSLTIHAGDTLTFLTQGGGGLGNPLDREPSRVCADTESGYISQQASSDDYGVVWSPAGMDQEATNRLRDSRPSARDATQRFDYGPARLEYETTWNEALQDAVVSAVLAQPSGERATCRSNLMERIEARRRQGEQTRPEDVPGLVARTLRTA